MNSAHRKGNTMNSAGWIKLHRQIWSSDIWQSPEPFDKRSAWIDLLLLANHSDNEYFDGRKMISVSRGQLVTSLRHLADRWHWSKDKTQRYLRHLSRQNMIHTTATHSATLITIVKYDDFQGERDTYRDMERDKDQDTNQSQTRNNKNKKNDIYVDQVDYQTSKTESTSDKYITFFEELWKLYPKKRGKGQVSSSQKKKLYQIGRDEMIRAIERYKRDTAGKDSQYIQYGSTFFNKGYIDYLDSNYTDPEQASDLDSIVDQCMHDEKGISS